MKQSKEDIKSSMATQRLSPRGYLFSLNAHLSVLLNHSQSTFALQALQCTLKLRHETLVPTEIVTEESLDLKLSHGALCGLGLELLDHGVVNLEGLASVVDAAVVAEPSGSYESEAAERSTSDNLLSDAGHDELRNLAAAAKANTGKLVLQGGVGEAA